MSERSGPDLGQLELRGLFEELSEGLAQLVGPRNGIDNGLGCAQAVGGGAHDAAGVACTLAHREEPGNADALQVVSARDAYRRA